MDTINQQRLEQIRTRLLNLPVSEITESHYRLLQEVTEKLNQPKEADSIPYQNQNPRRTKIFNAFTVQDYLNPITRESIIEAVVNCN